MKTNIFYGICQILKGKILSILTLVMMTIGIIMIMYAEKIYIDGHYNYLLIKNNIDENTDDIMKIDMFRYIYGENEEYNQIEKFFCWLENQPEIKCCGAYNYDYDENMLFLYGNIGKLYGLDCSKEEKLCAYIGERMKKSDKIFIPQYGEYAEFEGEIKGGKKFIALDNDEFNNEIVKLDESIVVNVTSYVNKNKVFLCEYINYFFYVINDNYDNETTKKMIMDKAKDFDLDIDKIYSVSRLGQIWREQSLEESGEKYLMPVVLVVIAVLSLLIVQMISYINNRKDAGILMVYGLSYQDVCDIYFFEMVIKNIFAFVLGSCYWMVNLEIFGNRNKFFLVVFFITHLAVIILVSYLCNLIIRLLMRKKEIVDFIKKG